MGLRHLKYFLVWRSRSNTFLFISFGVERTRLHQSETLEMQTLPTSRQFCENIVLFQYLIYNQLFLLDDRKLADKRNPSCCNALIAVAKNLEGSIVAICNSKVIILPSKSVNQKPGRSAIVPLRHLRILWLVCYYCTGGTSRNILGTPDTFLPSGLSHKKRVSYVRLLFFLLPIHGGWASQEVNTDCSSTVTEANADYPITIILQAL